MRISPSCWPGLLALTLAFGCSGSDSEPESEPDAGSLPSPGDAESGPSDPTEPDAGPPPRDVDNGEFCRNGRTRPCGRDIGVCRLVEQECKAGTWEPCPGEIGMGVEVCDGEDNDCNGRIDDGLGVGTVCISGIGECQREGRTVCDPANRGAVTCDALPLEVAESKEACGKMGEPTHCDICDGLDNDCDGVTDEHIILGGLCEVGEGACRREGTEVCAEDGSIRCSVEPAEPADELCGDEIDNDCNGEVDDGFDVGAECEQFIEGCVLPGRNFCTEDQRGVVCRVSPEHYPEGPPRRRCAPVAVKLYACGGKIDVAWTPVPGAREYRVVFRIPGGGQQAESFGGRSPRYERGESSSLRGLQDEVEYELQVASQFGEGSSTLTRPMRVTTGGSRGEVIDNDDELVVPEGAVVTLSGTHAYRRRVQIDGIVCVEGWRPGGGREQGRLRLEAPEIRVTGAVVASGAGRSGGNGPPQPFGDHQNGGGGGHGAEGARGGGDCDARGGPAFGSVDTPEVGSGGGGGGTTNGLGIGGGLAPNRCGEGGGGGGPGGGAIALIGAETVVVRGDLIASGGHGAPGCCQTHGGGGAGGGILLSSPETKILGRLIAGGGAGGGAGAGGRVKAFGVVLNQGRLAVPGGLGLFQGNDGEPGTTHTTAEDADLGD